MNEQTRPNIVFLMSDQHRWDALGVVNPVVKTPNIDALARRGVHFRQAVCNAPLCVPSRYSMMLGLYPSQCGVRHNTQMIGNDDALPVPTLPQRLAELGYQTAGFGKTHWYLGSEVAPGLPVEPSTRGFEIRAQARSMDPLNRQPGALMMSQHDPQSWQRLEQEVKSFGRGGESIEGYLGVTSAVAANRHKEAWLTDRALEFLDNQRDPRRPFFLYLSFDFPHPGFNVPAEYEALYDVADIPDRPSHYTQAEPAQHVGIDRRSRQWASLSPLQRRRSLLRYYALCSFVDDRFGQVLHKLESLSELKHTFVVFCSDHGEMLGDRMNQFSKYTLYESSVRVPVVIAGPGVGPTQRGSRDDRPAELVDILPTLLDVAGARPVAGLSGSSLLTPTSRRAAFCELHGSGYEERQSAPAYMWRTSEWKLILYLDGDIRDAARRADQVHGELYSLKDDPHEFNNLFDSPDLASHRERLTRELLFHLATVWARFPDQGSRTSRG